MQKRSLQIYTITQSKVSLSLHPAIQKPYEFLTKLEFATPLTSWSPAINDAIASSSIMAAVKISAKEFQITGGLLAYRFYELLGSNDRQIDVQIDRRLAGLSSEKLTQLAWLEMLFLLRFQLHTQNNRVLFHNLLLDGVLPQDLLNLLLSGDPEHPHRKPTLNWMSELLGIDRNCISRAQNTQNQHKQALTELNSGKTE